MEPLPSSPHNLLPDRSLHMAPLPPLPIQYLYTRAQDPVRCPQHHVLSLRYKAGRRRNGMFTLPAFRGRDGSGDGAR